MKFTQRMTTHLNGRSKWSELHYEILCDGEPTGITRHTRTNGSPKYLKTIDVLVCGTDEFDLLKTNGVGAQAWLENHVKKEEKGQTSGQ